MSPRRRKRRGVELRNSVRLGALLVVLVGVNIYVFFFNQGTAPREILRPTTASTVGVIGGPSRVVKESAAPLVPAGAQPSRDRASAEGAAPPRPATAGRARTPSLRPTGPGTVTQPVQIPFAPRPLVQIPFALPEDEAEAGGERVVERKFGTADTLGQVLAREGFGAASGKVVAALTKLLDPKLIRGGQAYSVRLDEEGEPEAFEYKPSAILRYIVERDEDGAWHASKSEHPVEVKPAQVAGVVESSLYGSVQQAGESTALVSVLVDMFAWDINFYTDTHPGDQWKVVVEKQYLGGQFYKYGRVLAAEYSGKVGTFRAFFWQPSPKAPGRYYDERGQSVTKTMLKTPLRFVRISSKFDRKRFHPILHREKAHLGVDYAAPTGTPVWAPANGRVVEAAMKRGSGNTVVIAHGNGLATRYYHLSRFARGLKVGMTVKQKDVIGYVGTTGLSTGPHLHFSVTKNGAFVDPMKLQPTREAPAPDRAAFLEAIRPRLAALKTMKLTTLARN